MQDLFDTICVCGAGTMGTGIAQVAAQYHFKTILFDKDIKALAKARHTIENDLNNLEAKEKITATEKNQIQERISYTAEITSCKADLVIEAVVEQLSVKVSLFNQLSEINNQQTIFASNTSSLSISEIASSLTHPERVAGMHFFNPPAMMKLVEVVKGKETAEHVTEKLMQLAKSLEKTPVLCKDLPGFIVNRVARPYYLESLKLAELGIADFETIDEVMEATGFKMGPFRLMDLIGNDINLSVTVSLYEAYNRPPRFLPSDIQLQKVKEGNLGRKSGKGYYDYE